MNDPYSELGLTQELAVSPDDIDSAYREASRCRHPDFGGNDEDYELVRQAADLLKSPSRRLRWALDSVGVEWDERGSVPTSVMDLFSPIAGVLQKVDGFVVEREKAKSALGKAVLDVGVPALKKELEKMLEKLEGEEVFLVGKFGEFDRIGWSQSVEEMAEASRGLAFVEKWQGQVRAGMGKLFQVLLGGEE